MKTTMRIINIVLLLFVISGCGTCRKKNKPAIDVNEDGSVVVNPTAAAQTEFLAQTQMAGVEATREYLISQIEATAQGLQPTQDAAVEATPIPTLDPAALFTPPPAGSTTLQLSGNTNCRSGPGTNYGILDIVLAGQAVEVLGADNSGAYYVVQSPNGQVCWLWSHYASVNGNPDSLVVMTPPAPPQDVYTGDWVEPVTIQVSDEFSWQGHWVVGAHDGSTYKDWFNAILADYEDSFRYGYVEIDIFQNGDFLEIELTELLHFWDGTSALDITYGIAQVSEDNTIAVGKFYLEERTQTDYPESWAVDIPILWYQNGNPNQFVGDFYSRVPCGARSDAELPFPCTYP